MQPFLLQRPVTVSIDMAIIQHICTLQFSRMNVKTWGTVLLRSVLGQWILAKVYSTLDMHGLAANHAGTSIEACMQPPPPDPGKSTSGLVSERDVNRQREVAGQPKKKKSGNRVPTLGPSPFPTGADSASLWWPTKRPIAIHPTQSCGYTPARFGCQRQEEKIGIFLLTDIKLLTQDTTKAKAKV
jgi:hypothetical protein